MSDSISINTVETFTEWAREDIRRRKTFDRAIVGPNRQSQNQRKSRLVIRNH